MQVLEKGTAYEYFSSKEEMIAKAIYWHGNQRFLELVENLKRQKSLKRPADGGI